MLVLYLILAVLAFWLLFVTKKPANSPPGPWFRLPLLGHSLWFIGGRIKGYRKLRDRQDIYTFNESYKRFIHPLIHPSNFIGSFSYHISQEC